MIETVFALSGTGKLFYWPAWRWKDSGNRRLLDRGVHPFLSVMEGTQAHGTQVEAVIQG